MTRLSHSQQKKRTCRIVHFTVLTHNRMKIKESEKRDKYLDLARELKKTMKRDRDGETICGWYTWDNPLKTGTETRRLRNQRTNRDHPDYCIVKIWRLKETCCQSISSEKPSANAGVKNSQKSKTIMIKICPRNNDERNTRAGMTEWEKGSTGSCARY